VAYLALEPRQAELLAVGKGIAVDGPLVVSALRAVVTGGTWTTFTPKGGERTTVAVVPDAAVDARLFSTDDAAPTPLEFSGNRIVVRTPGSATISWRRAKGRWISLGVGLGEKAGTPVTATLLDGSHVTVDLGNGVVRTIPIGGAVYGFIPGGYQLSRDNTITLTKGTISVAPAALLTDDCANPPIASTIAATNVTLDPARPSSALLNRDGTVTANLNAILHAILALRQANGCGAPTVPSGLADTPLALALSGTIQRGTGLTNLRLVSAPTPVTLQACLTPGDPSQGCLQPAAVPATMTADVAVKVQVG
jgi:hypothetical protein